MLKTAPNPLLFEKHTPEADTEGLGAPNVFRRKRSTHRREIRDLRRQKSAAQALEGFSRDVEIYGFTKGQFSIIDILTHLLTITGPAELTLSTWTAANTDVGTVLELVNSGHVTKSRWLVDLTFQRRSPQLAARIRDVFGMDSIRVAKNHAKFSLIKAGDWRIVVHTSMNLNFNPRFENFSIAHDPAFYEFHEQIIDELWSKQPASLADDKPYEIHKFFDANM